MKKHELTKNFKRRVLILSIFFIFFSVIFFIMYFTVSADRTHMIFVYIIGTVVYFMVICVVYYKNRISVINSKLVYLTEENELLKKNFEPMNRQIEEIDKFRHDARNYLSLLKHEDARTAEREKLAGELLDYTENLQSEKICENMLVSLLLSDKQKKAKELDIKFECKVTVPNNIPVESKDICSCFFNLIDNAICANETLEKTSGKWITVKSNIIGNYLIIKQSNSMFTPANVDSSGNFLTTKLNKNNHGKGLEIIKDIAEKYNGDTEFKTDNNVFYSTVYLYLDDSADENMQNMTN